MPDYLVFLPVFTGSALFEDKPHGSVFRQAIDRAIFRNGYSTLVVEFRKPMYEPHMPARLDLEWSGDAYVFRDGTTCVALTPCFPDITRLSGRWSADWQHVKTVPDPEFAYNPELDAEPAAKNVVVNVAREFSVTIRLKEFVFDLTHHASDTTAIAFAQGL